MKQRRSKQYLLNRALCDNEGAAWAWNDEVPYGNDYRYSLFSWPDRDRFKTWPVILRGSRIAMRLRIGDRPLAMRFCLKAAYRLRLNTPYSFHGDASENDQRKIAKIVERAFTRYPRQRTGADIFDRSLRHRFSDGVHVAITAEPAMHDLLRANEELLSQDTNEFWSRERAARDLLRKAAQLTACAP